MKKIILSLLLLITPFLSVSAADTTLHVSNIQDEDIDLSDVTLNDFANDAGYVKAESIKYHMVDGGRSFDYYNPPIGIQKIPPYPIAVDVYKVSVLVYNGTSLTGCLMECDGAGNNCVNLYSPTKYNNTEVEVMNFTDKQIASDVWWAWNTTAKSGTVRIGASIYFNETVEQ